jgi:hypothetical protein
MTSLTRRQREHRHQSPRLPQPPSLGRDGDAVESHDERAEQPDLHSLRRKASRMATIHVQRGAVVVIRASVK